MVVTLSVNSGMDEFIPCNYFSFDDGSLAAPYSDRAYHT
jgi:hypothetical protein